MEIHGESHRLERPLDFAAVTDHAEFIGEMFSTQVEGALGYDNPTLVELRGLIGVAPEALRINRGIAHQRGQAQITTGSADIFRHSCHEFIFESMDLGILGGQALRILGADLFEFGGIKNTGLVGLLAFRALPRAGQLTL